VPREGSISAEALAKKAGLDVDRTVRVLRMLCTHRFFHETRPGNFSHTAASAVFNSDENLRCAGSYLFVIHHNYYTRVIC
jgi:hypothetical protein